MSSRTSTALAWSIHVIFLLLVRSVKYMFQSLPGVQFQDVCSIGAHAGRTKLLQPRLCLEPQQKYYVLDRLLKQYILFDSISEVQNRLYI